MNRFVGIDLHKRLLVACIVDEAGKTVETVEIKKVDRESLEAFCKKHLRSTDKIAIEVTTHVWAVVRILQQHVSEVVVSNPMATKAIAQAKVKTDKVDSRVLAHLLRLNFLPSVWAPSEEQSRLREWTARRNRVVQQRTQVINRMRTCLAMRLLDCPFPLTEKSGRQWMESVELDEDGRELIDSDLRLLDALQEEIDFLDKKLAQRVWQDDRVKLLMTIPGISQNVAQSVVAAVGDMERFESPEKLASYFGLVPSTRQSASRCYHGGITKAGRSEARWALVQAAHACARCDLGPLGHFFTKVKRRKSYNSAIVALARKLSMLCWHLLKTGKPYRYAKPQSVELKLQRLRVLGSGKRRRGGVAKGVDPRTMRDKSEQNLRHVAGLDEVLEREGLPPSPPLSAGERKMLEETGTLDYCERLVQPRVRGKTSRKSKRSAESSVA